MDKVQQDFVTDARGATSARTPPITYFNGQKRRMTEAESRGDHHKIRTMRLKVNAANQMKEAALAELCGLDMHSTEWEESIQRLYGHGFVVPIRQEWDGKDAKWAKLLDADRKIQLLGKGLHFASMTFEQCMLVAGGR